MVVERAAVPCVGYSYALDKLNGEQWCEPFHRPCGPILEKDCSQSHDFCYVDKVARANVGATTRKRSLAADVFNVAQGSAHTLLEVKDTFERSAGRCFYMERHLPRGGDVYHTLADTTWAGFELKCDPSTDFRAQLFYAVAW